MLRIVFCLLVIFPGLCAAQTLELQAWRGGKALRISGVIEKGLADRLAAVLPQLVPYRHGVPVLLLDSPGGNVGEALRVSALLGQNPVHMVVPDGANCSSACASILFIAGAYRTAEPFAELGQHSCAVNGKPLPECNEILAQHAIEHGVSHGSIMAFVSFAPPDQMMNFSREDADGWGWTRYPGEREGGFEKSEPRAMRAILGKMPPAQAKWRLDFREDGYRAFLRPVSDFEREMQVNLYCDAGHPGNLYLSMEINGPAEVIAPSILGLTVTADALQWAVPRPVVWQMDEQVTEVVSVIPAGIAPQILTAQAQRFEVRLDLRQPYEPIVATTTLIGAGQVFRFAAANCAFGRMDRRAPLPD